MVECLAKYNKSVLLLLANEFETSVSNTCKSRAIIQAIVDAVDYDESFAKIRLQYILEQEAERKEQEKQIELDRKEKEKQIELDRKERERQIDLDRIAHKEKLRQFESEKQFELNKFVKHLELDKLKQQFELEKLRIQNSMDTVRVSSNALNVDRTPGVNLKDLVPRFDTKLINITLFFMIFERQAKKAKISQEDWVSQGIPLLPSDIAQIIVKQLVDKWDDFQYIKKVLLNRFKLSTCTLTQKFENHQRRSDELWVDLIYELRGYLDNWLESLEVRDFESFKELMLPEQLKNMSLLR